jgi:hypothetical protein
MQAASISANKQLKTVSSGHKVQPLTTVNSNNDSSQKTEEQRTFVENLLQNVRIHEDEMKIIQYSRQDSSS